MVHPLQPHLMEQWMEVLIVHQKLQVGPLYPAASDVDSKFSQFFSTHTFL